MTAGVDWPTLDEVIRVHRAECAERGHLYREVEVFGTDGPVAVVCRHCDGSWRVVRDDDGEES